MCHEQLQSIYYSDCGHVIEISITKVRCSVYFTKGKCDYEGPTEETQRNLIGSCPQCK